MKFIEMENKKVLKNLLILCKEIKPTINIKKIESIALTTIKYLTSSKEKRQKLQYNQTLEKKWYKYLKKGKKYYEVYADDKYIAELWACYIVYSKKYLKMIFHPTKGITDQLKNIKSILDLGCGFGHTTINLKEYFPNSMVYGSNIKNTLQIKVAYKLSKKYNFKIISDLNKLNKKIDLLFASEYFEHIEKPIDNLLFIINKFNPKYLLIANSFGTIGIGHFYSYLYKNKNYSGKEISKIFNLILKENNYKKIKTSFWNNRPTFYIYENKKIKKLI